MQEQLFPEEPAEFLEIPDDMIDTLIPEAKNMVVQVDRSMIESVQRNGVMQPILLIKNENNQDYTLAAGRRRIAAFKQSGKGLLPARVYPFGWTLASIITLTENECRRPNIPIEWKAVQHLMGIGKTNDEIMIETGISSRKLLKLQSLGNLNKSLAHAFEEGGITSGIAMRASKQKLAVQRVLATILKKEGKLTQDDIAEARRNFKDKAIGELPKDLFGNTAIHWQKIVMGRLGSLKLEIQSTCSPEVMASIESIIILAQEADQADQAIVA